MLTPAYIFAFTKYAERDQSQFSFLRKSDETKAEERSKLNVEE
jgi:hypothetical protein